MIIVEKGSSALYISEEKFYSAKQQYEVNLLNQNKM